MKRHLIITCAAYTFFGIGLAVQQLGIQAGLGLWPTISIFSFGILFLIYAAFTSLQTLKDFIKKHDKK